jgi:hypothetical protein
MPAKQGKKRADSPPSIEMCIVSDDDAPVAPAAGPASGIDPAAGPAAPVAKRVLDALDLLESDAEALPACFFEAKQRRKSRKAVKKIQVYSEDDEETPEKMMHLEAEKLRDEEDLRSKLHRKKMESTFKEHAETKKKLAETEAKLAAKEAELADTKDELADLQAKHARVSADYDKHWAYMQVLRGQLELVRDELNMREESGNHPQELIDRAKAENAEHQAGLDQLLKRSEERRVGKECVA